MTRFYEPDLSIDPDSPFVRDAANKLVRRSYWLDLNDRSLVMAMVDGVGTSRHFKFLASPTRIPLFARIKM